MRFYRSAGRLLHCWGLTAGGLEDLTCVGECSPEKILPWLPQPAVAPRGLPPAGRLLPRLRPGRLPFAFGLLRLHQPRLPCRDRQVERRLPQVVNRHTPALRLEQNGTSGFTPQTWDIAGNEANFFVRSVTTGSQLPFRIRPGAPTSSIDISADGDVGFGTASPSQSLHIRRTDGTAQLLVEEATGTIDTRSLLTLKNNGGAGFTLENSNSGQQWRIDTGGADFNITLLGTGELAQLDTSGNLTIDGEIFTSGSCMSGCDLVFDPDYQLPSIEEHSALMRANKYLPSVGPTPENGPFNLSKMTGGMLNELEKAHLYIEHLNIEMKEKEEAISELRSQNEALTQRLAAIEAEISVR